MIEFYSKESEIISQMKCQIIEIIVWISFISFEIVQAPLILTLHKWTAGVCYFNSHLKVCIDEVWGELVFIFS